MTVSLDLPVLDTALTADLCIKCNICTAACPVAAVTDLFPGPKVVGPQAQRYRALGAPSVDRSVDYCSACGVCSRVCPHGIQIAEMNLVAKARLANRGGLPLRSRLLGRSEWIGRLGSLFSPLSDLPIQNGLLRAIAERVLGVSRGVAFPRFARPSFRAWFQRAAPSEAPEQPQSAQPPIKVVYFHGCSTNYYEPRVGQAAVKVLRHLGCDVTIAEQNCCGLPMQSNGEFSAARAYARSNLAKLAPYVRQGYVIVGTSTSCTLTFKHEYHAVLGLSGEDLDLVSGATYDFFEFLERLEAEGRLRTDFRPPVGGAELAYHAPCQFRTHAVGRPAADLLRRIPGVRVTETQADCCGVAGTYGLKAEKYKIAVDVGRPLFAEIAATGAPAIACDSETCRWWLAQHTGLPAVHPVEILAQAYGL
jgi:glycerol-3-phosphate dehydrogenase subunit C